MGDVTWLISSAQSFNYNFTILKKYKALVRFRMLYLHAVASYTETAIIHTSYLFHRIIVSPVFDTIQMRTIFEAVELIAS